MASVYVSARVSTILYFSNALAAIAVFLFSFVPAVLAHVGLATTDMALTAFLGAAFLTGLIWVINYLANQGQSAARLKIGVTSRENVIRLRHLKLVLANDAELVSVPATGG
jgi:4-amino-4-deoxy-L-arabinose transferase-like glycosyltransferase